MINNIKKRLKAIDVILNTSDTGNKELIINIGMDHTKTYIKDTKTGEVREIQDNEINKYLYDKKGQTKDNNIIVKLVD